MTNTQRLAFIQYQLEMINGCVKVANFQNKDENKNALFVKLRNQLFEVSQTMELLNQ